MTTKNTPATVSSSGLASALGVRLRGAGIHLVLSLCAALLAFCVVYFVWYPGAFWRMAGGRDLFQLIVSVDVVLGPVVTFAIFNPGKGWGRLKFDLVVIGLLQLSALVYGLHTVAQARPVFVVYTGDRFNLVAAADLNPRDVALAERPEFAHISWSGPRLVGTRAPADENERFSLITDSMMGKDVELQPKFYIPYDEDGSELAARALPLQKLRDKNPAPQAQELLGETLRQLKQPSDTLRWLPVMARTQEWVALLDARQHLQPVAYLPLLGF